tara:strand:- start:102 stop:386 length:285 start_codon:yes stop_codon:yes gene_type:complete
MKQRIANATGGEVSDMPTDQATTLQADWDQWETDRPARDLEELRQERNALLLETDWWATSDLTMSVAQTKYRKDLRDITDSYQTLATVVWPTKP